MRRIFGATAVAACAAGTLLACTAAAVPAGSALSDVRRVGTVSEWNLTGAGGYQVTGQVNLAARILVEPRRRDPNPDVRVVGIFTDDISPFSDSRPGAIHFATNTQAFRIVPNISPAVSAQGVDVARVQVNAAARRLDATVDPASARTTTANLFRTQTSFISTPAQVLSGSLALTFSADARTLSGAFDLGGGGLIEPGNTQLPVRRYQATVTGTALSVEPGADTGTAPPASPGAPPASGAPATPRPVAPRAVPLAARIVVLSRAGRVFLALSGRAGVARRGQWVLLERRVGTRVVPLCRARVRPDGTFGRACRVDQLTRPRGGTVLAVRGRIAATARSPEARSPFTPRVIRRPRAA